MQQAEGLLLRPSHICTLNPHVPRVPRPLLCLQPLSAHSPLSFPSPTHSIQDLANKNVIKLGLKPVGTGIYPIRLLLTSALDTRVIDVELMAQTMTQEFNLEVGRVQT
jgi:hypothetical protein